MKRRTRTMVGAVVGAVICAVFGCPVTLILIFQVYWNRKGPGIGENLFAALTWGGFVAFGTVAGALAGRFGCPEEGDKSS